MGHAWMQVSNITEYELSLFFSNCGRVIGLFFTSFARFWVTICSYFSWSFLFSPMLENFRSRPVQKLVNFSVVKEETSYSPAGRSVMEKTVPEVLVIARGRKPRPVLKTEGTVFPIRTHLGCWITFLFFSTTQRKTCERLEHFRAVIRATNWTVFSEQIVIKTEVIQVKERGFT